MITFLLTIVAILIAVVLTGVAGWFKGKEDIIIFHPHESEYDANMNLVQRWWEKVPFSMFLDNWHNFDSARNYLMCLGWGCFITVIAHILIVWALIIGALLYVIFGISFNYSYEKRKTPQKS